MKTMLIIVSVFFVGSAVAAECPVDWNQPEHPARVISHIEKLQDCDEAVAAAQSCGYGSSIDLDITFAASQVCQKTFPTRMRNGVKESAMSTADKQAYIHLNQKCYDKWANESGTMYRSFTAHCQLKVMQLFSNIYRK